MEFYVGDRVCAIESVIASNNLIRTVGKDNVGTIMIVENGGFGIAWDKNFGGHDLAGRCKSGHGWWCLTSEIALAPEEKEDYDLVPATDEELSFLYS